MLNQDRIYRFLAHHSDTTVDDVAMHLGLSHPTGLIEVKSHLDVLEEKGYATHRCETAFVDGREKRVVVYSAAKMSGDEMLRHLAGQLSGLAEKVRNYF